jgi:2-hydroxy-3-oxopropionate reductase
VSGGPKGAQDGTLSCMIGGEAAIVARCMPVFQGIGKTFTHVGANGAGQACKSCSSRWDAYGGLGGFCPGEKLGIDPYKVRDALLGGSAQSFVLANHGKRLLDGTLQPGFRAELLLKDIKLAQSTGRDTESFMPVTALALQLLTALCNSGRNALDSAALGLLFEELRESSDNSEGSRIADAAP